MFVSSIRDVNKLFREQEHYGVMVTHIAMNQQTLQKNTKAFGFDYDHKAKEYYIWTASVVINDNLPNDWMTVIRMEPWSIQSNTLKVYVPKYAGVAQW